jgi:hypothetical protein
VDEDAPDLDVLAVDGVVAQDDRPKPRPRIRTATKSRFLFIVVIASAFRTEDDPGFEFCQGVRILGIYTLQCCFHDLYALSLCVVEKNKCLNFFKSHFLLPCVHTSADAAAPARSLKPKNGFARSANACSCLFYARSPTPTALR